MRIGINCSMSGLGLTAVMILEILYRGKSVPVLILLCHAALFIDFQHSFSAVIVILIRLLKPIENISMVLSVVPIEIL